MIQKCISVRQPWASLLMWDSPARKDCENRSWQTPYRGRILIHTGQYPSPFWENPSWEDRRKAIFTGLDVYSAIRQQVISYLRAQTPLPTGCILGSVDLTDIEYYAQKRFTQQGERISGWHLSHCYGWKMVRPVRLVKPVAYPGQLGLFDVKERIAHNLEYEVA